MYVCSYLLGPLNYVNLSSIDDTLDIKKVNIMAERFTVNANISRVTASDVHLSKAKVW